MLDLVSTFRRHLAQYARAQDTDSDLAAYLSDAVEALNWRWSRSYAITYSAPNTYSVDPDITAKDKRPIVLMGSIIYKVGNVELAGFKDGDFAYDPQQGRSNPITLDIQELDKILGKQGIQLARATSAPMRGFSNAFNPESPAFWQFMVVPGSI